jgi:diguanylate cyclase (GGDEF)-like protein
MSLIIMDLDDIKIINDHAGHLTGDRVLRQLTSVISSRIRASDRLYRYGGDEFMVLAHHSDASTAHKLSEDIRALIARDTAIKDVRITVSIGIAEYRPGETADEWLLRADNAMYSVKRSGKNAVSGSTKPLLS